MSHGEKIHEGSFLTGEILAYGHRITQTNRFFGGEELEHYTHGHAGGAVLGIMLRNVLALSGTRDPALRVIVTVGQTRTGQSISSSTSLIVPGNSETLLDLIIPLDDLAENGINVTQHNIEIGELRDYKYIGYEVTPNDVNMLSSHQGQATYDLTVIPGLLAHRAVDYQFSRPG